MVGNSQRNEAISNIIDGHWSSTCRTTFFTRVKILGLIRSSIAAQWNNLLRTKKTKMDNNTRYCTLEDQLDRFPRNAQATNWIEVLCWIINLLYFDLPRLRSRQNTAQLVKILSYTTQRNVVRNF